MNNPKAIEIVKLTDEKSFEEAYLKGRKALEADHEDMEIMDALCHLTAKLRQEAIGFAHKRANYSGTCNFEELLKKANLLTGQDMYGRFI